MRGSAKPPAQSSARARSADLSCASEAYPSDATDRKAACYQVGASDRRRGYQFATSSPPKPLQSGWAGVGFGTGEIGAAPTRRAPPSRSGADRRGRSTEAGRCQAHGRPRPSRPARRTDPAPTPRRTWGSRRGWLPIPHFAIRRWLPIGYRFRWPRKPDHRWRVAWWCLLTRAATQ